MAEKAQKTAAKAKTHIQKADETVVVKPTYYEGVGRRRESTARVRLYVVNENSITVRGKEVKKGEMIVNGKDVEVYFPGEIMKKAYVEPLRTTNTIGRFAITVTASGGGLVGQLGSVVLGISRALEKVDKEKFRPILKKRGFLTRDARIRQRRKAGLAGKSRKKKQSPKR